MITQAWHLVCDDCERSTTVLIPNRQSALLFAHNKGWTFPGGEYSFCPKCKAGAEVLADIAAGARG